MSERKNVKRSLKDLAAVSAQQTDEILEDEIQALLSVTREQLEALKPQITDQNEYEKLMAAVEEANREHDASASLKMRLLKGGGNILKLGKKAAGLLLVP